MLMLLEISELQFMLGQVKSAGDQGTAAEKSPRALLSHHEGWRQRELERRGSMDTYIVPKATCSVTHHLQSHPAA